MTENNIDKKADVIRKDITTYNNLRDELRNIKNKVSKYQDECMTKYHFVMKISLKEYFFYYEPSKVFSLADLLQPHKPKRQLLFYEFEIRTLKKVIEPYCKVYNKMIAYRKKYWQIHKKFNSLYEDLVRRIKKYCKDVEIKYKPIKFSRGTDKPSKGELSVITYLDKLTDKYDLRYFYLYRWDFCRHKLPLEVDFYCILFHDNNFFQFVIEYDGMQHYNGKSYDYKNSHIRDILKQHYLYEMNVHLLRIPDKEPIEDIINSFINTIVNSEFYVAINPIEPNPKLFTCNKQHAGLLRFYNYAHPHYTKCYKFDFDLDTD